MTVHPDILDEQTTHDPLDGRRWRIDYADDTAGWLAELDDEVGHCVILDRPQIRDESGRIDDLRRMLAAAYEAIRPGCHGYIVCELEELEKHRDAAEEVGWDTWRPLVWDRTRQGAHKRRGHYDRQYLMILRLSKQGCRSVNYRRIGDVVRGAPTKHGGLPTDVAETLLRQSTDGQQIVVCAGKGAGTIAEAAVGLCRRAITVVGDGSADDLEDRLGEVAS